MIVTKEGLRLLALDIFSDKTKAVYINSESEKATTADIAALLERLRARREGLRGLAVRREGVFIVTA